MKYKIGEGISGAVISHLQQRYPEWEIKDETLRNHMIIRMKKGFKTVRIVRGFGGALGVSCSNPFWLGFVTLGLSEFVRDPSRLRLRREVYEEVGRHFGTQ
jgi:hypothetical protein